MKRCTRNYFFQITEEKELIIGEKWDLTNNQLIKKGVITYTPNNTYELSLEFKVSDKKTISLQKATIDEVIEALKDVFSGDDFAGFCSTLFLWGQSIKLKELRDIIMRPYENK